MIEARRFAGAVVAAALLVSCAPKEVPITPGAQVEVVDETPTGWRAIASDEDQGRIDRIEQAWDQALDAVRASSSARSLRDEGELLEPHAGLARAAPPPGPYRCRVIKLGSQGKGPVFTAYKSFFCYVEAEGELLTIVKQTGSQRPAGRLYPDKDDEDRLIFLGTMALGDEKEPLPYGEQSPRDMAGVVERVAPFRYRLAIPFPREESILDVFELVPVTPEPPAS